MFVAIPCKCFSSQSGCNLMNECSKTSGQNQLMEKVLEQRLKEELCLNFNPSLGKSAAFKQLGTVMYCETGIKYNGAVYSGHPVQ